MQIIPAIDIIEGKCVRLTQGDYGQKKIYNEHPLEVALQFQDAGIIRLHLVDLDGAKAGKIINYKTLETIAAKTHMEIDFGGGIKTAQDIEIVLNSGATMATIGSIAVKNPELFHSWIKSYGPDRLLLGADVKDEKVAVSGWLEQTDINIIEFIHNNMKAGIVRLFCTDISKDGLLQGASLDLYRKILSKFPELKLIASGGVSSLKDLEDLDSIGCEGAIVGKAIYEGRVSLNDLQKWN